MFILGAALLVAIYLIYKWFQTKVSYFDERNIKNIKPSLTNQMFFQNKPLPDIINDLYKKLKDQEIAGFFDFLKPVYIINDPKLVKKLAVKDFDHFLDHRQLIDESIDKLFGKSLFNMRGQKWKDMRATLSPLFTGSKMRQMYTHVATVGNQTSNTIREQILKGNDGVVEFKEFAMKFTVDTIASAAFGIEINSFKNPDNEFQSIAKKASDFTNVKTQIKILGYLLAPPIMRAFRVKLFDSEVDKFFQEAVCDMIKYREEKRIIRHDMINLLIQAKKGKLPQNEQKEEIINEGFATVEESQVGKSEVKTAWTDEDLAAQAFIFFFAGFDTVATTMGFLAYELTANPEAQEKLYEEIRQMEEELDGKQISYEQIQGLKYLDQCVSETLRKWPAAPSTDRLCVKDYEYDYEGKQMTIEKGRFFLVPIHGFHHDPKYFPSPEKFDPDRFSPENRHNIDADTYLPFGVGPRNCIGSRFALMEIKTIFYYLLVNFSFEVSAKTQIPLRLRQKPLGLKTEKGIWVELKPRNN